MTTYYVNASTGSNSNNGLTTGAAFATIQKGADMAWTSGDIVQVMNGTYIEVVYWGQSNATLMAYPGHTPIIDGSTTLPNTAYGCLLRISGNYNTVTGFEVRNANTTGAVTGGACIIIEGHHNTMGHMKSHDSWDHGIQIQGDNNILEYSEQYRACLNNSATPGTPTGGGTWANGIESARNANGSALIANITSNSIVRYCTVYNNYGEGLSAYEADSCDYYGNTIYDNWAVNLYVSDATNNLIHDNIVYNSSAPAIPQRVGGEGITLADELIAKPRSNNNKVYNNMLYNSQISAFSWTLVANSGLTNSVIAYNTLIDSPLLTGSGGAENITNTGNIVKNNIFYSTANDVPSATGFTFSYNCWLTRPAAASGTGDVLTHPIVKRQGTVTAGTLTSTYFKLNPGSPCINTGSAVSGLTTDAFGLTRDATPDIGAHEYVRPILYIDHGLYGTHVAGGTVPTVPEDGNGQGTAAGTMATLVINFTGLPTAAQAITIAGTTFTAVASGATGNQFNIGGTATITGTNLAAAINASTTTSLTKPVGVSSTAILRNLVNAVSVSGVVTVYSRASGSEWNSCVETSTLANCTVTQWKGGTDGAWGYLYNNSATIWPSSIAIGTYGAWASTPPHLGTLAGQVRIRSNKTITRTASSNETLTVSNMGTVTDPVIFLVDDSTTWADGANPVLTIERNASASVFMAFFGNTSTFACFKGIQYSSGAYNLSFLMSAGNSSSDLRIQPNGGMSFENVSFIVTSAAITKLNFANSTTYNKSTVFTNCLFRNTSNVTNAFVVLNANVTSSVIFKFCTFDMVAAPSLHTGIIAPSSNSLACVTLIGCKFTGFVALSKLISTATNGMSGIAAYDCDFGNVTNLGPFMGATTLVTGSHQRIEQGAVGFIAASKYNKRDFVFDTPLGFIQWNHLLNFPYLNATLLDDASDVTPWSILMIPPTAAANIVKAMPLTSPCISKINSLSTGIRALIVEIGIEKSLIWDKSVVWAEFEYVDSAGTLRRESTYDVNAGNLTDSTAAWSGVVNDSGVNRFTYVNGATFYFNRYKLQLTTAYSIKTNTEISVFINIGSTVADATKMVFVDPEVSIV